MNLTVSPSPHVHGGDSISKNMYWVLIALIPTYLVSVYNFGIGALVVMAISIISCLSFEFLIQKYLLKKAPRINDGSAIITGALLAMNVPTNLPWWIIVMGALVAIGIAKMSFGGLGNNLFNPALVGRVFLLISFPVQMTTWPEAMVNRLKYIDASTGATPLSVAKEMLKGGASYNDVLDVLPSIREMAFGFTGGSMGEVAAIALLIGLAILLYKKIITWHIPVITIGTVAVFSAILHYAGVATPSPAVHLLSGGLLLGAIFMATDYVTSPMTNKGMIIFGIGIGFLTVIIRVFGAYPEGVSFAILIMNALVPLIDRWSKPKRFGKSSS
ncbi:MAG: RnfABCDGE type electron transport complex subunit D [Bacteroidales bacterium]|jgi:electron transport complex protein RnfD|nr:RnfABCDGE type electron transport complex subunit D [Bacteroidales bacterium]